MSSKQFNKTITSTTEPINGLVGDEWFNPLSNKLYKYLPVNKLAPQWCEIPQTNIANNLSLSNVITTGTATFSGSTTNIAINPISIAENISLAASPIVGVVDYYVTSQTIIYVTAASTGNFIVNITGNPSTSLNSLLNSGQSISCVLMVTNGATAYYPTALRIDGLVVAPKWQGGTAPATGNTSAVDIYSYTIVKTANATFSAFASQTKFS